MLAMITKNRQEERVKILGQKVLGTISNPHGYSEQVS
jgi:hypothetical protein